MAQSAIVRGNCGGEIRRVGPATTAKGTQYCLFGQLDAVRNPNLGFSQGQFVSTYDNALVAPGVPFIYVGNKAISGLNVVQEFGATFSEHRNLYRHSRWLARESMVRGPARHSQPPELTSAIWALMPKFNRFNHLVGELAPRLSECILDPAWDTGGRAKLLVPDRGFSATAHYAAMQNLGVSWQPITVRSPMRVRNLIHLPPPTFYDFRTGGDNRPWPSKYSAAIQTPAGAKAAARLASRKASHSPLGNAKLLLLREPGLGRPILNEQALMSWSIQREFAIMCENQTHGYSLAELSRLLNSARVVVAVAGSFIHRVSLLGHQMLSQLILLVPCDRPDMADTFTRWYQTRSRQALVVSMQSSIHKDGYYVNVRNLEAAYRSI